MAEPNTGHLRPTLCSNPVGTQRVAEVAGIKIAHEEYGTGEPLVLLHRDIVPLDMSDLVEELARSFRVIIPWLPGYGQSERPAWARSPRDIALLMMQWKRNVQMKGVHIVGLGLGGWVAMEMASCADNEMKSLSLLSPFGIRPSSGDFLDQFLITADEYVAQGFDDVQHFEQQIDHIGSQEKAADLWEDAQEMTVRIAWSPYMHNPRLKPMLREIRVPTLVLWGEDDAISPSACANDITDEIPSAVSHVIPAGHFIELEAPREAAQLLRDHCLQAEDRSQHPAPAY